MMKKTILLFFILVFTNSFVYSQVERKIIERKVSYESVFEAEGISAGVLSTGILSFLKAKQYKVLTNDSRFIYAQGGFPALYRSFHGPFVHTTSHICTYDIKIEFKAGKVRYKGTNYILNKVTGNASDVAINVTVEGEPNITTHTGEQYPMNDFYNKTAGRFLIFQRMDGYMNSFDEELQNHLIADEDW